MRKPYFSLEAEMDGTLGYKIANDYRMARMLRGLYTNPKLVWRIARSLVRHPRVTGTMIECYFIEKSWDWQFWGDDPPMKLCATRGGGIRWPARELRFCSAKGSVSRPYGTHSLFGLASQR